jgi:hypothetical protein
VTPMRCFGTVLALCAALVVFLGQPTAAEAQSSGGGAPTPKETHDAYYIAKTFNNVRGTALVEQTMLGGILHGLHAQNPTWSRNRLVHEVIKARDEWRNWKDAQATQLLSFNEQVQVFIQSLSESPAGALGPVVGELYKLGWGRARSEAADYLQAVTDAQKVGGVWKSWRDESERVIQDALDSDDPDLRAAWDTLFGPANGALLDDSTRTIIDSDPILKADQKLNALIGQTGAIRNDIGEFRNQFEVQMGELQKEIAGVRERLTAIDDKQKQILEWMASEDRRRAEEELQKQNAARTQLKLDAARSSVYLLSTFIGFSDPKLGREVGTVGNAAIQVAESLNSWSEAMSKFGKVGDSVGQALSSAVMTGNVVGAIMSLIPLFVDTGPTPEQMILDEIGALRDQVEALHKDMSARFDRIDAKLNTIYETLETRFDQVNVELGRIHGGVRALQDGLIDVQASIDRFGGNLFELVADQEGRKLWLESDRALGYRDRTGGDMPYQPTYVDHESFFFSWATAFAFDSIAAGPSQRSYKPEEIATELRNPLDEKNLNYLAEVARQLGVPFTGARMPSPRQWALGAGAYGTLALEWPAHAVRVPRSRFEQIELAGRELRSGLRAISTIDTAAGPRANRPLFARLFDYYRANAASLNAALLEIENSYLDEPFPAGPHGRSLRERGVDLFGAPDQELPMGQLQTVDVCDVGGGDGGPLSVPSNATLEAMIPNALDVAQRLEIGWVGFCYRASYVDEQRSTNGSKTARLRVDVMTTYSATPPPGGSASAPAGPVPVRTLSLTGDRELYCDIDEENCRKPGDEATLRWERGLKADFEADASLAEGDPALLDAVAADVTADLKARKAALYRRFVDAFKVLGSDVRRAAQRLTGAKALLEAFVGFGLPRALAHDELMQALLFGSQRLLDEDAESRLSGAFAAAGASPPAGNLRMARNEEMLARLKVLEDVVDAYLARIDRGEHEESQPMVELALGHVRITRWLTYDATKTPSPCEPYPQCTEQKPCEPYPQCTERKPCEPYPQCTEVRPRFSLAGAKWSDFAGTSFRASRSAVMWNAKAPAATEGMFHETLRLLGRVPQRNRRATAQGAARRRNARVVLAEASLALQPGERRTVRIRLTRVGTRLVKRARGRTLAVTARLAVRFEPASGQAQARALEQTATIRATGRRAGR